MTGVEQILVIKLGALGDMVLAQPALARIRAFHPAARITLLTTPPFQALARACPHLDAVEADGRPDTPAALLALVRRLRRAKYARIYDLQCVDRTNLLFQLLRPFPPPWSGVAFGCALPHRNRARMRLHTLERQAEQLDQAGLPPGPMTAPDVGWMVARADPILPVAALAAPLALVVPGVAASRPRKRWPPDRFAAVAAGLMREGFAVAVLAGPQDQASARETLAGAPGALNLAGRTDLFQLAWLGARAAIAVGADTGPMHLLAAAGAPAVSLFSADSDPAVCAPRGAVRVLARTDLGELTPGPVLEAALQTATPSASRLDPRGPEDHI